MKWMLWFRSHSLVAGSLLLNLALGITSAALWLKPANDVSSAPAVPAAVTTHSTRKEPAPSTAPAFHWRQLDAADFPTFVKNLRAIGCPESTLRDIVAGELAEIYAEKRSQLIQPSGQSSHQNLANGDTTALQTELARLQTEQAEQITTLLGRPAQARKTTAAASAVATQSNTKTAAASQVAMAKTAATPAAFLVGNAPGENSLSAVNTQVTDPQLAPGTAQTLNQLRTRFAAALTASPTTDPSSEEYMKQWIKARRDSDEVFSSMFGGDALIQTQIDASRAAALPAGIK